MSRVIKLAERFAEKYSQIITDPANDFADAEKRNDEFLQRSKENKPRIEAWNNFLKNMPKTLINAVGKPVTDPKYIEQLQRALQQKGYDLGKYGPDGKWGQWTFVALYNFQGDNSIPQTGKLDQQTVSALGLQ